MKTQIPDLPEPIWEPLHIFSPYLKYFWFALFFFLLIFILWLILFFIYRSSGEKKKKVFLKPQAHKNYNMFYRELEKILKEGNYKKFVFYLSYYLRMILEERYHLPFLRKTPKEIQMLISDPRMIDFFIEIEYYKFSKESPDFDKARRFLVLFNNLITRKFQMKKNIKVSKK